MATTAIIFDIDGTLIDSEHIDARFFVQAVRDVCGDIHLSKDWSSYKKVTDIGIITEILIGEKPVIIAKAFYPPSLVAFHV